MQLNNGQANLAISNKTTTADANANAGKKHHNQA